MDWELLLVRAKDAAQHAYAPYSDYQVGAAAYTSTGAVVTGCNVENESYGLTLCAECGLISALKLTDAGAVTQFVCVHGGNVIMPCGRCRQLLIEHSAADATIMTPQGEQQIVAMLPQAFSTNGFVGRQDEGGNTDE